MKTSVPASIGHDLYRTQLVSMRVLAVIAFGALIFSISLALSTLMPSYAYAQTTSHTLYPAVRQSDNVKVTTKGNDITFTNTSKSIATVKYAPTGGTKKDPQVITFKPGKYLVPRVTLESNVIIKAKGATLYSYSSGGFYVGGITKTTGRYSHLKNVRITGGTYICRKSNSLGTMMKFSHAKDIHLDNFTIRNCYGTHFIEYIATANSTINKVKLLGEFTLDYDNEAIQLVNLYKDVDAQNCDPIDGTPCKNITIKNTKIKVPTIPYGIGTSTVHSKCVRNIKIINCDIKTKKDPVLLIFSKDCTVKNCTFHKYHLYKDFTMTNLKDLGNKTL